MNDRNNKTSICSIVFLDIVEYSNKTDSEQIEIKNQFNSLINHALKDVAENDRIIIDTGDGAAIASNGSPEDILFISLNIRDEIIKSNIHNATPLYVRFGVNLGPVRVVKDINGRPNMIGDGINVAQRIMTFAKPNQILVSRSYYEVTSRLTQEISQMFDYFGVKQDKHVREHEVYSVRLLKEHADSENISNSLDCSIAAKQKYAGNLKNWLNTFWQKFNWRYVVLTLPAFLAFFLMINKAATPIESAITANNDANKPVTLVSSAEAKTVQLKEVIAAEKAAEKVTEKTTQKITQTALKNEIASHNALLPSETIATLPLANSFKADNMVVNNASATADNMLVAGVDKTPKELLKLEQAKKKAKQKAKKKAEQLNANEATPLLGSVHQTEVVAVKNEGKKEAEIEKSGKEKSGWNTFKESVKKGGEVTCSQAQIAMNLCH